MTQQWFGYGPPAGVSGTDVTIGYDGTHTKNPTWNAVKSFINGSGTFRPTDAQFGAVGNGTTDDTSALQACITAAFATYTGLNTRDLLQTALIHDNAYTLIDLAGKNYKITRPIVCPAGGAVVFNNGAITLGSGFQSGSRTSGTLGVNPFSTTNGQKEVVVAHTSHGLQPGDLVTLSGATAVGGLTVSGSFPVWRNISTGTYSILMTNAATGTATGGGSAVAYTYDPLPYAITLATGGLGGAFRNQNITFTNIEIDCAHRGGGIYASTSSRISIVDCMIRGFKTIGVQFAATLVEGMVSTCYLAEYDRFETGWNVLANYQGRAIFISTTDCEVRANKIVNTPLGAMVLDYDRPSAGGSFTENHIYNSQELSYASGLSGLTPSSGWSMIGLDIGYYSGPNDFRGNYFDTCYVLIRLGDGQSVGNFSGSRWFDARGSGDIQQEAIVIQPRSTSAGLEYLIVQGCSFNSSTSANTKRAIGIDTTFGTLNMGGIYNSLVANNDYVRWSQSFTKLRNGAWDFTSFNGTTSIIVDLSSAGLLGNIQSVLTQVYMDAGHTATLTGVTATGFTLSINNGGGSNSSFAGVAYDVETSQNRRNG